MLLNRLMILSFGCFQGLAEATQTSGAGQNNAKRSKTGGIRRFRHNFRGGGSPDRYLELDTSTSIHNVKVGELANGGDEATKTSAESLALGELPLLAEGDDDDNLGLCEGDCDDDDGTFCGEWKYSNTANFF